MGVVRLHGPLRKLAGGGEHRLDGATVAALLRALERDRPALAGWILDERGHLRRHLNVFVAGDYATEDAPVGPDECVDVLQSISGGG